jgi:TRAP transporter TAXI family solute receptor
MKRATTVILSLLAIILLVIGCAPAATTTPATKPAATPAATAAPLRLSIFTGGTAGVYYPLGGALANIINTKAKGVEATAVSSGASVVNAQKTREKEAGLTLIQNDIASFAYSGVEMFKDAPVKNIRGISMWYPETVQFVTLKESGIKTLADLKGKRVGVGAPGSGTAVDALIILNAVGVNRDNTQIRDLNFNEVATALQDKTIDAGINVAGYPTSAITDVATSREIFIVEIPDDVYNSIKVKYPFFVQQTIPAGTYKGHDKDVKTLAVMAMLTTREEIPDDVVYSITKALYENLDMLVATHAKGKEVLLKNALAGMPIPVHPGAQKYFTEKGIK